MERITAVIDGPLGFLAAYAFMSNSPWRYTVQLVLSLCQLYGDTLYFLTEIFEGFQHGEYLHPIYFWFYFFFMNMIWIVIPSFLVIDSWCHIAKVQRENDKITSKNSRKSR